MLKNDGLFVSSFSKRPSFLSISSACYGYLIPALEMLKNDGLFEKLDTKICIGQGYRGKTGKLGVGACTCKFEHNVKGCPPTENQIYDFLKQYILGENK